MEGGERERERERVRRINWALRPSAAAQRTSLNRGSREGGRGHPRPRPLPSLPMWRARVAARDSPAGGGAGAGGVEEAEERNLARQALQAAAAEAVEGRARGRGGSAAEAAARARMRGLEWGRRHIFFVNECARAPRAAGGGRIYEWMDVRRSKTTLDFPELAAPPPARALGAGCVL